MNRYILLLCAFILLAGCSPSAREKTRLGVADSVSTVVTGEGKTTQIVYVGGKEFAVHPAADVTTDYPLYRVLVTARSALGPPAWHICEHGAFSDPLDTELCYPIN